MDNFMDKISQKLNSQEIIRANAAADAAALENLEKQLTLFKDQMLRYDDCLLGNAQAESEKYRERPGRYRS